MPLGARVPWLVLLLVPLTAHAEQSTQPAASLYSLAAPGPEPTKYTIIPPFVRASDARGSTSSFLGLVWHWQDRETKTSTTLGFPLFIWHHAPHEQGGIVGPGYGYRDQKGWLGGFFPLLFLQDRGGRSYQVIPPLFVHAHNSEAGTDATVVGPVFVNQRRDGWDAGLFPLLFMGEHADRSYGLIPGVYYYSGGAHDATHVLGPLYLSRGENSYAVGLAPLFHFGASQTGHLRWFLPPIYLHRDDAQSSFTLVGPFFWQKRPGASTSGFFPLLWLADRGTRKYVVVAPLFADVTDKTEGMHNFWVGPLVHLHNERRQSTTNIFFPLVVDHQEPGYHVTVQFPFYWHVIDGSERTTAVFPFYLHAKREDLTADVAFPLVWRFASPRATTTVVGPAFWQRSNERTDFGVVPVFGGGWGGGRHYAWSLPLLFYHADDAAAGTSRTIFSLFFHDRTPTDSTTGLVPLFFAWRRGAVSNWLSLFVYHRSDSENDSALTVVGPLYFGHERERRYGAFAPLFFFASAGEKDDERTWRAGLVPLFYAAKKTDGSRLFTPLFGYAKYAEGARGYVGPTYFRNDRDGWAAALFPLFYHDTDHRQGTATTFVLPLLLRRVTPEDSLLGVTPLVWHYRSIEATTTVVFPFYFDHHAFFDTRTTGVFPFALRHKNFVTDSTTWVFPLLWLNQAKTATEFVLFPLLWRLGEPGSRSTIVFPLFWDFRRSETTVQVLFPFYVYVQRPNADHYVILNVYFRRGHGSAEGSYAMHFIPLFDVGRPHPGDLEWNIFEGLIGYSRIGRTRKLKLFYSVDVPLQPVGATSTTFFDPRSIASQQSLY